MFQITTDKISWKTNLFVLFWSYLIKNIPADNNWKADENTCGIFGAADNQKFQYIRRCAIGHCCIEFCIFGAIFQIGLAFCQLLNC